MTPPEPEFAAFSRCWNEGRFFEAHEVLEGLWMRTRDRGQQGLIQLAAALYHAQRGNVKGARTMIDRALPRLRDARAVSGPIDLDAMRAFAERFRDALDSTTADSLLESRPRLG